MAQGSKFFVMGLEAADGSGNRLAEHGVGQDFLHDGRCTFHYAVQQHLPRRQLLALDRIEIVMK